MNHLQTVKQLINQLYILIQFSLRKNILLNTLNFRILFVY